MKLIDLKFEWSFLDIRYKVNLFSIKWYRLFQTSQSTIK